MSASIGNQLTQPAPAPAAPAPPGPPRPVLNPLTRFGPAAAPAMAGPRLPTNALRVQSIQAPAPAPPPPEQPRSAYGMDDQVNPQIPAAPEGHDEAAEAFTGHAHDNIVRLWNEAKNRPWMQDAVHQHWGDNMRAHDLAQEHGITHRQAAAAMANLAPETDRVDRMLALIRDHKETPFDEAMRDASRQRIENRKNPELRKQGLKELESLPEGAKLGELKEPLQQALFAKAHSLPEVPVHDLHQAFKALRSDEHKNIEESLGSHLVRSRYNNIIAPDSPEGHVTIDTPAINAAHFMPHVGREDQPYGRYVDAYRRAAGTISRQEGRRYLPREVQSVASEAARRLFDRPEHAAVQPQFLDLARTQRNPEAGEPLHHVGLVAKHYWNLARHGVTTPAQTRQAILNAAGGVSDVRQ